MLEISYIIYKTNYCINLPNKAVQNIQEIFYITCNTNYCINLPKKQRKTYRKFLHMFCFFRLVYAIICLIYHMKNFLYVLHCCFWQIYAVICLIYFASVFSATLNHIFVLCIYRKYLLYWTRCSLNWSKKHVENLNYFFPNGASQNGQ